MDEELSHFWLLSFADSRLLKSLDRVRRQAEDMRLFGSRIKVWTEVNLDSSFCARMGDRMVPGSRGFGYWCWKPQVILQLMNAIPDGDVILYVDAGCHLNRKGVRRLVEYYELANKHGIVAFQARALGEQARKDMRCHYFPECVWTKMDMLNHFGVASRSDITNSGQCGCGCMLFKKCKMSVEILQSLRELYFRHFELCDDTPSTARNAPGFKEHRHDQSAFSILCKMHGVFTLSSAEHCPIRDFMPEGGDPRCWPSTWKELDKYPIWTKQDLGKYTRKVECPDWLKPVLGKVGRKLASGIYDVIFKRLKRARNDGHLG